ncbi:hypothetical protein CRYUN_Cryun37aG0061500 [Craigia yunnanensis]
MRRILAVRIDQLVSLDGINLLNLHRPSMHRHFGQTVIQAGRKYPNLDEYYQKNSSKFWDNFYKRHKTRSLLFLFFFDRHYLEKDWGQYFPDDAHSPNGKVVLEVGCGADNTIFPLVAAYPKLYVQACDISSHAVVLVKSHVEFRGDRVNAFVCDVTVDNLLKRINPSSVDVITLVRVAISNSEVSVPASRRCSCASLVKDNDNMITIMLSRFLCCLQFLHIKCLGYYRNIKRVLKPDGYVLLRDYAVGDFAQCSFYVSKDFLSTLFLQHGFNIVDISTYCKQIKNRHKNITMDWCFEVFSTIVHFCQGVPKKVYVCMHHDS